MFQARRYFYILVTILLTSCASAPTEKVARPQTRLSETPDKETVQTPLLEDFIQKAKLASDLQRGQWLLKAAQAEQSRSCEKSIAVSQVLLPTLSQIEDITLANLIQVECFLALGFPEQAIELQDKLLFQMGFDNRIHRVKSQLFETQEKWLDAAHSLVLSDADEPGKTNQIWALINQLSVEELDVSADYQRLIPWLELSKLVRRYGAQPTKFNQQLLDWQRRYPSLPIPDNSHIEIGRHINSVVPSHVGIILPLTGKNEAQGQAIKNGILAAYINFLGRKPKLTFYDSNLTTFSSTLFKEHKVDAVIGPLLKENIPVIRSLLAPSVPLLALNRIEHSEFAISNQSKTEWTPQPQHRYYFALAPEDEATQLAEFLNDEGYTSPLVVATSANVSERMLEQFNTTWTSLTQHTPEYTVVDDTKSMREALAQAFSFTSSEERIKQIEELMRDKLYTEKRNRRDIDAVVILANSAQTELLNPIIESNISPFSEPVPVFASSRSYRTDMSENALRDFRNVRFTEMPWMLPDNPWQLLSQRVNDLWPNQPDINTRLFGMGYDAFNLLPLAQFMALYPTWCYSGLTGELCMDSQSQIKRTLPIGKIDGTRVVNLGMVK